MDQSLISRSLFHPAPEPIGSLEEVVYDSTIVRVSFIISKWGYEIIFNPFLISMQSVSF